MDLFLLFLRYENCLLPFRVYPSRESVTSDLSTMIERVAAGDTPQVDPRMGDLKSGGFITLTITHLGQFSVKAYELSCNREALAPIAKLLKEEGSLTTKEFSETVNELVKNLELP